jgi:hypothetical protein
MPRDGLIRVRGGTLDDTSWLRPTRHIGIVTETGSRVANRVDVGMATLCYHRHRFPAEIIQHAIWLYLRVTLSYRDVEELLAERGVEFSLVAQDFFMPSFRLFSRSPRAWRCSQVGAPGFHWMVLDA